MSVTQVEFSEGLEVLEALQATAVVLAEAMDKPLLWKSTLIAVHTAVRGVLILTLTDRNGLGALDERSTQYVMEWLASTQSGRQTFPPVRRYASFPELLQRAQRSVFPRTAIPLTLWPSQRRDLERLDHEVELFRSRFAPAPFTISIDGMAPVIETCLVVVDQLMGPGSWARRTLAAEQHHALEEAILAIRRVLQAMAQAAVRRPMAEEVASSPPLAEPAAEDMNPSLPDRVDAAAPATADLDLTG